MTYASFDDCLFIGICGGKKIIPTSISKYWWMTTFRFSKMKLSPIEPLENVLIVTSALTHTERETSRVLGFIYKSKKNIRKWSNLKENEVGKPVT